MERFEYPERAEVRVCADAYELGLRAGRAAVTAINTSVQAEGRCALMLSGGNTPRTLYRLLATEFRDQIPWAHVHVFWADERYVPDDDPASNYRMAREALLDHVACPAGNIHPMPTHFESADAAAWDYEATLKAYWNADWPRFDLSVLGLGEDGHTASLFPRSPALDAQTRWVVAVDAAADPPRRLTLTMPVLTRAASTYVLVSGANKAKALRHVLSQHPDSRTYPAAAVRATEGTLIWWTDRAAARWMQTAL